METVIYGGELMDELTVHFPDTGESHVTIVRDLQVNFDGRLQGLRLVCTEAVTNAIKRAYPTCQVWLGEKRLA